MPAGRLGVSLEGIGYEAVSQVVDNVTIVYSSTVPNGSVSVGLAVTISANDTIALCADGDAVFGKLLRVSSDGVATVQIEGFTTLPGGLAAALTLNYRFVGALGAAGAKGYIRAVAPAVPAELVKGHGIICQTADATNVMVELD